MRIAVWHNLPSGGAKRALYDHVKGLISRGHYIESWCPDSADQSFLPLGEMIKENILPLGRKKSSVIPMPGMYRYYKNFETTSHRLDVHCSKCSTEIRMGGFDVLFANMSKDTIIPPISRYSDLPKLLYLQEPNRRFYEAKDGLPWIAPERRGSHPLALSYLIRKFKHMYKVNLIGKLARNELDSLKLFDSVLTNSYFSSESIKRAYGVRAIVSYLGVDLNHFKYRKMKRENFVIGIGAFHPSKNIDFVIRSISLIRYNRPKLIWAGNSYSGSYLNELVEIAHRAGVEFEYLISITDRELVDLLNRAAAMVYAPRLEPFGYAPIEAGACRLPVITIPEGGIRETVIDRVNGIVVQPDEREMADAIEYLSSHKTVASELGGNGFDMVQKNWTIEHSTDRIERNLSSVIRNKSDK